jgi:hypothetical protein
MRHLAVQRLISCRVPRHPTNDTVGAAPADVQMRTEKTMTVFADRVCLMIVKRPAIFSL